MFECQLLGTLCTDRYNITLNSFFVLFAVYVADSTALNLAVSVEYVYYICMLRGVICVLAFEARKLIFFLNFDLILMFCLAGFFLVLTWCPEMISFFFLKQMSELVGDSVDTNLVNSRFCACFFIYLLFTFYFLNYMDKRILFVR